MMLAKSFALLAEEEELRKKNSMTLPYVMGWSIELVRAILVSPDTEDW